MSIGMPAAERLDRLDSIVELLAVELRDAQADGVSPAMMLPRMLAAFKRSFGDPPDGLDLAGLAQLASGGTG